MLEKIFCKIGKHDYKPVLRTYDVFSTSWTDVGRKDYWSAHFLKCKHCGDRKFETDYGFPTTPHRGLNKAKNHWLDHGHISDHIKNPQKYREPEKPKSKPSENPTFTSHDKINKMIMKALDSGSESEAESCLRMARRVYRNAKSKTA